MFFKNHYTLEIYLADPLASMVTRHAPAQQQWCRMNLMTSSYQPCIQVIITVQLMTTLVIWCSHNSSYFI